MSASAAALQLGRGHRLKAVSGKKRLNIATGLRRNTKGLQAVHHLANRVPDGGDVGTGNRANGSGHVSANSLNVHGNTSFALGSTYADVAMKTSSMRGGKSPLSPDHVENVIGAIIRSRPVKVIADAADRPVETVKYWRKVSLPDAWAALTNLMRNDDEVFEAILVMAGRTPPPSLGVRQRQALADALRILEARE
jgi:hypothetical protein